MKNTWKRIGTLLLALAICLSCFPATAWATETEELTEEPTEAVIETEEAETETEEEAAGTEEPAETEAVEETDEAEAVSEETATEEEAADEADESGIMTAATEYSYGSWKYTVSNSEATVTEYTGSSTTITIPSTLGGYTVTGISSYVFENSNMTTLTIPESITDIGYHAFYNCTKLTKITINAKTLNDCHSYGGTFYNAGADSSSLTVTFGSSVKKIPAYLFYVSADYNYGEGYYAHITSVTISDSVEEIGASAFQNCYDLTSVSWGSGITSIGKCAFENCAMTSVTIPSGTTSIGYHAFYNCTKLTKITINAKTLDDCHSYGGTFYNAGADSSSLTVTFGSSVKKIPAYLFYVSVSGSDGDYAHITSVTISDSVEEIGASAFQNCYDLTSVSWGSGITSIGKCAFENCAMTSVTIPSGTTSIGYHAFYNCTKLTKITINAKTLDDCHSYGGTFYNAGADSSSLTVTFGSSVKKIPAYLFYVSADYNYGEGYYAHITSVTIPTSVEEIGKNAFQNCYDLANVYYSGTKTAWAAISIGSGNDYLTGATIHYSSSSVTAPTMASITNTTSGVKITWNAVSGATSYNVYRKASGSSSWSKVGSSTTTSYTSTGVTSGVTYTFTVQAVTSSGSSSYGSSTKTIRYLSTPSVTLSNITGGVKVSWTKSTGATGGYYVYRRTESGSYTLIAKIASGTLTYTDKAASAGVRYYYMVRAYSNGYYSAYASQYITRLGTPTGLAVTNVKSGVQVTWNSVKGATSYEVYRKASGSTSWSKVGSSTTTSYISQGVSSGVTYTFTVRAVYNSSKSDYNTTGKTIRFLSEPTLTVANAVGGVKLTWTKSTGATGGYYVYRRTASGSYTKIASIPSGTLTYTDKNASAGVQYYYAVRAYSNGYYSSYTEKGIVRLGHPTLTLTSASTGVKLTWTKSTNCTGYYIYRKSGTGSYTRIKTITSASTLTWTDTTAKSGTTYTYYVCAYKSGSTSSYTAKSISY